ncbi:MAG: fused MFS/spermidine synthase [Planctomycetia bacterium]
MNTQRPAAAAVSSAAAAIAVAAATAASGGLFLLELLAGKILLPRFGGAPSVWISCLAFFQAALVVAALHADRLVRRRGPRFQLAAQAAVFAVAVATAPAGLALAARWARPEAAVPLPLLVLATLAAGVGPVFFAVATLSPLYGHWRSLWPDARGDHGGRTAYGLYAAGNAGSFAMLAAYPTLLEPLAGIGQQIELATRLVLAVIALTLVVGGITIRFTAQPAAATAVGPAVATTWRQWLGWAALAAVPSSWLASVTTHATVEVAPIPLLWVVPLAVYLASFVVVFSAGGRRLAPFEGAALLAAAGLAAWLVAADCDEPAGLVLAGHLAAFGVACTCIHGMLVDRRPVAAGLSSFYLALAVGGACGGLFNAVVAPVLFDAHHEFPLAIAAAAGLAPVALRLPMAARLAASGLVAAALVGTLVAAPWLPLPRAGWLTLLAAAVATAAATLARGERALALCGLLLGTFFVGEATRQVLHRERTFFGVLRVCGSANGPSHVLMHGGIRHGVQLLGDDPARRRIPLAYYNEAGPLGSVFAGLDALGTRGRVGVAGLGVGTLASYARPGDEFVFYEIDPAVAAIAADIRWFTFLADCRGTARVVVDDARRALEREPDGSLDLLVVDAFTGDSVPTHLLTREAFALYGRKLRPAGVLALHVSNKYLDFVPVVEAVAAADGWMGVYARDVDVGADAARIPSEWMALSRSLEAVQAIYARPTSDRWQWRPCAEAPAAAPWTDDRTAVIEAVWHRRTLEPAP